MATNGSYAKSVPLRAHVRDRAEMPASPLTQPVVAVPRIIHARNVMSRYQFEADLTHLEQIIPLLLRGNPLALSYWRRRVSSLLAEQSVLPDGNRRVTRLLQVFDEVECALLSGKPTASRLPGLKRSS